MKRCLIISIIFSLCMVDILHAQENPKHILFRKQNNLAENYDIRCHCVLSNECKVPEYKDEVTYFHERLCGINKICCVKLIN